MMLFVAQDHFKQRRGLPNSEWKCEQDDWELSRKPVDRIPERRSPRLRCYGQQLLTAVKHPFWTRRTQFSYKWILELRYYRTDLLWYPATRG